MVNHFTKYRPSGEENCHQISPFFLNFQFLTLNFYFLTSESQHQILIREEKYTHSKPCHPNESEFQQKSQHF